MAQHMAGPDPEQPVSDGVISFIRTGVPLLWGLVVSWLVGLGLPAAVLDQVHTLVVSALTVVLTAGWYGLWRWLEPRLPSWLVAVVLGYAAAPLYWVGRSDRLGPGTGRSPVPGSRSTSQHHVDR
jgi:MFS superfamily sulfate permease-like transporter